MKPETADRDETAEAVEICSRLRTALHQLLAEK